MKRTILTVILTLSLILISALSYAAVGKITALKGNVDIVRHGQEAALPASLMQAVSEGDVIRTKSGAKAEITFADKSAIRLAPGSRIEITKYLLKGNERKESVLTLFRGKMRVIAAGRKKILGISFSGGQKFEVQTPVASADVNGADGFIFHIMGVTGIAVADGKADIANAVVPGQAVTVISGNVSFVSKNKAPQPPRPAADVEMIRHSNDTDTKTVNAKSEATDAALLSEEAAMTGGDVFGYTEPAATVFESELKADTLPTPPISERYPNTLSVSSSSSSTSTSVLVGELNDFNDYYYGSLFSVSTGGTDIATHGISAEAYVSAASTTMWSDSTSVSFWGPYTDYNVNLYPSVWLSALYSGNSGSNYLTFDGGAFFGAIGSAWQNQSIDGRGYALYIDPSGNAGILRGSIAGSYNPAVGTFSTNGTWTSVALATGLAPSSLGDLTYGYNLIMNPDNGAIANIQATSGVAAFASKYEARTFNISGQDWGVWEAITGGTGGSSSDTWGLLTEYKSTDNSLIFGTKIEGSQWSGNKLYGATYGYGADISATPVTWIARGETIGTFNPDASTWLAAQVGAYVDTNKFLSMVQTLQGRAALQQLSIPFIEVGRANLAGSGNNMDVNMNDVTFFAYQTGAAPKIWATGNVNGTYTAPPVLNTPVVLTGNGLNVNFNVQAFDTSAKKWTATVDGGGAYSGTGTMNGSNVQINGAAAGTNTGAGTGTFSGTGAGVAH